MERFWKNKWFVGLVYLHTCPDQLIYAAANKTYHV